MSEKVNRSQFVREQLEKGVPEEEVAAKIAAGDESIGLKRVAGSNDKQIERFARIIVKKIATKLAKKQ